MKKIIVLFFLIGTSFLFLNCADPQEKTTSFTVHIMRSGMMDQYNCYITRDSIMVIDRDQINGPWDTFVKYWSDPEHTAIETMVESWNVNDMIPGAATTTTDSDSEFTFEFERNGKWIYHEDIYKQKVDEIFELTNYIDKMLSPEFRINYNAEYLAR